MRLLIFLRIPFFIVIILVKLPKDIVQIKFKKKKFLIYLRTIEIM